MTLVADRPTSDEHKTQRERNVALFRRVNAAGYLAGFIVVPHPRVQTARDCTNRGNRVHDSIITGSIPQRHIAKLFADPNFPSRFRGRHGQHFFAVSPLCGRANSQVDWRKLDLIKNGRNRSIHHCCTKFESSAHTKRLNTHLSILNSARSARTASWSPLSNTRSAPPLKTS